MPQASGLQFTARVGDFPSDHFAVVAFALTERLSELFQGQSAEAIIRTLLEERGYPANLNAIREFLWHQLRDRMQDSVPNLTAGAMV